MKNNPLSSAFIAMGLAVCVGAMLSGGWIGMLGLAGLASMAAGGYAIVKKETEIEPQYHAPPVRVEIPAPETGDHFQQVVAEGRGMGRER